LRLLGKEDTLPLEALGATFVKISLLVEGLDTEAASYMSLSLIREARRGGPIFVITA
jgi:hypothetical protein